MSKIIKTFDNYLTESIHNNFNYEILRNFCATKNNAKAGGGGDEPTPRVQFIMNLLNSLNIEYELDTWTDRRVVRKTLGDFLGFSKDNVDEEIDKNDRIPPQFKENEKRLLKRAFDLFDLDINMLKHMLRNAENRNASKREKSILNMLIKFKKETNKLSEQPTGTFFNIYIKGSSDKMIMAHHDVMNIASENCNDNSASVINAIACKTLMPEINVVLTDGEEIGGIGAKRTAEKINEGYFGNIDFVLNFELTAVGGKNFFIEDYKQSNLYQRIERLFPGVETLFTPFHDGIILRKYGVDSIVINPLPRLPDGKLNYKLLQLCHSTKDNMSIVNFNDMKEFCEEVVVPIIRNEQPNFSIEEM